MIRDYKRLMASIGAVIVILLVFIVGPMLARSFSKKNNYDRLIAEAQEAFQVNDYENSIDALNRAIAIEPGQDAYLLLSDIYLAMDNIDKAIDVLYTASYKLDSRSIATRLELLKARKKSIIAAADLIELDGQGVPLDETFLTLSGRRLSDITPLSSMTSLRSLILTNNLISDLSPLSGLSQLGYLHLGGNQIRDLAPLSGLSSLRTLNLDGNPVRDFSPIYNLSALETLSIQDIRLSEDQLEALKEALPGCFIHHDMGESSEDEPVIQITLGGVTFSSDITELDLSGKGILDISSLSYCKDLRKLDLRNNYVSDLSPLSELNLMTWLNIRNNRVPDLSPLSRLYSLRCLDAEKNNITAIAPISALNLEELWISYNEISDPENLQSFINLRVLGIKGAGLEPADLNVFAAFILLEELELEDNELSIDSLNDLKEAMPECNITHSDVFYIFAANGNDYSSDAQVLDLSACRLTDIDGLENFTELLSLNLSNNSIKKINALSTLTKLKELRLNSNPLNDVGALRNLKNLTLLTLNDTGVSRKSDLQTIAELSGLRELHLEGNDISDISVLTSLSNLERLYIARNDLTDTQIFDFLIAMPSCSVYTDVDLSAYTQ